MGFIRGIERDQMTLMPEVLDEYISVENPVRFLDAFVDQLDLEGLGFGHASVADVGRPPYDPGDLLKLYLYGYLNRVRSSRRLERECGRNVELMWLLRRLRPDFKTIADFRKDNREPIGRMCRQFTLLCRRLELFGGELVAIDGSKFKAVNNRERNFTRGKLERKVGEIEEKIEGYLKELDEGDQQESEVSKPTAEELKEKIERMRGRQAQLQEIQQQLEGSEESQISLTDPDSRSMALGKSRGTQVGYNVQLTVDAKHKLIVDHEVTNAVTDREQLSPMARRAKEVLGVEKLEALADMGYCYGKEVKACIEAGITPYVPQPDTSANKKLGLFAKKDFRYDQKQDCYWCPAGESLSYRFQTTEQGREIRYYATRACRGCQLQVQCTRSREGRRITRWVHEAVLEQMAVRLRAEPAKAQQRKELVEHPFGTIKHAMNQGYFLMRGLSKVRAEMSLSVCAYNLKRVINILGVQRMIAELT
jgi:transposase